MGGGDPGPAGGPLAEGGGGEAGHHAGDGDGSRQQLQGFHAKDADQSPRAAAGRAGLRLLPAGSLHRRRAQAGSGEASPEPSRSRSRWETLPHGLAEPRRAEGEGEGRREALL